MWFPKYDCIYTVRVIPKETQYSFKNRQCARGFPTKVCFVIFYDKCFSIYYFAPALFVILGFMRRKLSGYLHQCNKDKQLLHSR